MTNLQSPAYPAHKVTGHQQPVYSGYGDQLHLDIAGIVSSCLNVDLAQTAYPPSGARGPFAEQDLLKAPALAVAP